MLNLVFLVVVSMMIAMVLSADKGLDITAATAAPGSGNAAGAEAILVRVRADGTLLVDGKSLESERIAGYLKSKIDPGSSPATISRPVLLRPDADAPYGTIVDALDELRQVRARLRLGAELHISLAMHSESASALAR
jgi:biopolymer transport protein ExbD